MKTTIQKIYKCDYCNKLYQVKSACEKHESLCFNNPVNDRPCFHCCNLEKRETEIESEYMGFEGQTRKVNLFHCLTGKFFVYTPQNELKGNRFYTEEADNVPMPKVCPMYITSQLPF